MKDIVFNGIEFDITDATVLNIRYKAMEQAQASTENKDSGIKKERSIFPAQIIIKKGDSKTLRTLINLQKEKIKGNLYITNQ